MKFLKKKASGGTETPDGVESRRRVNSNHQNIEYFFTTTASTTSSPIQCLVTATFHVRFQPSHGVEVGVERFTAVGGVALNSYKLGVDDSNVAGEKHFVAVQRTVIATPYHLHTVEFGTALNFWPKLHYTDTGYGHVVQHHQRTSSQQLQFYNLLYNKFATSQCQSPTSRHIKMLGCV